MIKFFHHNFPQIPVWIVVEKIRYFSPATTEGTIIAVEGEEFHVSDSPAEVERRLDPFFPRRTA